MPDRKTPRKTRGLPRHLIPGNPGNSGGKKGRSGRPSDAFRAMCRALACSAEEAAAAVLQDSTHPAFIGALKWATEHGYGKPTEKHEHSGPDGGPIPVQVWRFGKREITF